MKTIGCMSTLLIYNLVYLKVKSFLTFFLALYSPTRNNVLKEAIKLNLFLC